MNYVMKCIQLFDKTKMNWQNYSGCISRYNDPNGMAVPPLVILGLRSKAGDNRPFKLKQQCGSANPQDKTNPDGLWDSIYLNPYF